jgi:bifunctional non-homologous end joining protein LigD
MPLTQYRRKRRFQRTAEPRGGTARRPGHSFVVQKHDASHLHYDFRLELDGVLLSWAVPKGPSLDWREKRLAVHVEDHPLEYADFEGTIPAGEYGGGTVLVWDRGEWQPHGDPRADYRAGKLSFTLAGEKLRGDWTLVRMGGRARGKSKENWLLLKSRDKHARTSRRGDVLTQSPLSVKSGRDLDEIAAATPTRRAKRTRRRTPPPPQAAALGKRSRLPKHPAVQLATLVSSPPEGDDWLHEIKFDGYRMSAVIANGKARFISRNGHDWTKRLASLVEPTADLPVRQAVLDGEVVVLDEHGVSRFQLLQNALGRTPGDAPLLYFVFDLTYFDGRDLTELALDERKRILRELIPRETPKSRVRYSEHVIGSGKDCHDGACRAGLEGIISKRRTGKYRPGRSGDWLKSKCRLEQEFVVCGYTDPEGSRTGFGSLLLAYYDGRKGLTYAGRVGTGFTDQTLRQFAAKLKRLEQSQSPFDQGTRAAAGRGVHWIRPKLVAQIEFAEWTQDGLVRQAAFQGFRTDKPPEKVVRERPREPAVAKKRRGAKR